MQGLWWNDVLAGMTLRLYVKFALGLVLLLCTVDAEAQRDRSQSSKRQRKVQVQKKQERAKAENAAFKAGRKQHWKAQDGATRKRWRKQRRAAKRMRKWWRSRRLVQGHLSIQAPHSMAKTGRQQSGQPL